EDAVISPAEALQNGHAAAAEDANRARLRAWLEVELLVAFERGHGGTGAQRGVGHGQFDGRVDVVALTHEPLVRSDPDEHVDVAGLSSQRARVAFAGEPDALPVVDAGGNFELEGSLLERAPRPRAGLARMLDDSPAAAAAAAGLCTDELPERGARHL